MTATVKTEEYRDVAIFSGLTDAEIEEIMAGSERVEVAAGNPVFTEGEPGDGFYVILSGKCMVRKKAGGKDVDLAPLGPHAAIGEMGVLAKKNRIASVVAVEPTVVQKVGRQAWDAACERGSRALTKVVCNIARMLSDRLDKVNVEFGALQQRIEKETAKERSEDVRRFKDQLYKEWVF
jgi:CRP-like cAMP-binding protein